MLTSPIIPIFPSFVGNFSSEEQLQQEYDDYFEDIWIEMSDKYGPVEEMSICDNLGEHLIGNVYVKFRNEDDADKAVADLNNRWFNGLYSI